MRIFAALLMVVTIAFACVRRPSLDDLPVTEHAGHLTPGAAGSWFVACGVAPADSAWVTFIDRAVAQRDSLLRAGQLHVGMRHFVRVRAAVTEGGEVGPRGLGLPAYLVHDILAVRPAAIGDCP